MVHPQRAAGQHGRTDRLRQRAGLRWVAQGEVGRRLFQDHPGDGAGVGLAIGRAPTGEQPAGQIGFRVGLWGRFAQQTAQYGIDQTLERLGRLGLLGQADGGVDGGESGGFHIERLGQAQPQQHHNRHRRRLLQLGRQHLVDGAYPAQHGHGQHPGQGAVAKLQIAEGGAVQSLFEPAAVVEGGLDQIEGGGAGGEAVLRAGGV